MTAPLLPLTTEEVWRGLTGDRSVHLADWPLVDELPADDALVASMDLVREVCSATSALRKAGNLRNRLPLSTLTVVVPDPAALAGFEPIVRDEVNVKAVRLVPVESDEAASYGVEQRLTVNARAAGPRLGRDVQTAIKGSKSGDWSVAEDGTVTAGGLALVEGEYTLETVAGSADGGTATGVLRGGGFVVLDTEVTPELAAEGLARDLVRAVQQARRDARLDVSDRIALTIGGSDEVQAAASAAPRPDHRRDARDLLRRRRGRRCRADRDGREGLARQEARPRRAASRSSEARVSSAARSGTPQISSVTPASAQAVRSAGDGLDAIRTRISGGPSRPASAQAFFSASICPEMSCWVGVVIQPSAFAAIHAKVFGPPPAPMTQRDVRCTGLG